MASKGYTELLHLKAWVDPKKEPIWLMCEIADEDVNDTEKCREQVIHALNMFHDWVLVETGLE